MIEDVKKLIEQTIIDNNYILDDVLYIKEDGNYFLRVIIDKNGTIDVDDCVVVSKLINPILDEHEDLFDESYILDVCSKEKGSV
jgi:ribosome maturation factor RimP